MNETKMPTQITAAFDTVIAIADAIRDFGRVPSGHLYARVMAHMSFETYDADHSHPQKRGSCQGSEQ